MNVIRVYCGVEYWIATEGRSLIQSTIIFYPSVYREGKNSNNFPANHRLSALPPRDDHLPPEGKLGGGVSELQQKWGGRKSLFLELSTA